VHVYNYELREVSLPEFSFRVVCSKGFYVRTYAHEIGAELGCGGHLSALRRTKSGKFSAEGAITFDELKHGSRESVAQRALSLADVSRLRGA
jgi:tRNA pseudouridine55 synthase